jgi:hypothetical protein
VAAVRCAHPQVRLNKQFRRQSFGSAGRQGTTQVGAGARPPERKGFSRAAGPEISAARHAGSFSVNTSPDVAESNANFDSVDSCKQKPHSGRL